MMLSNLTRTRGQSFLFTLRPTKYIRYRARDLHTQDSPPVDYHSKYAEKLHRRAQEKGLSVDELRARSREELQRTERMRSRQLAAQAASSTTSEGKNMDTNIPSKPSKSLSAKRVSAANIRKDSSPVKPLSSILNVPRLLSAQTTSAQTSALWTAYHASRSGGTGRGYICAMLPIELYEKMAAVAGRYPAFVVPVPRVRAPDARVEGEEKSAYEFYFLQWTFHETPPAPSATEPDPFSPRSPPDTATSPNPSISTILFTPLQEYKLRNSFATPYLVLTFYTDLARSHGVVLLRGEITPSATANSSNSEGRYLLTQEDAQLLAMGLQKFYLWGQGHGKGEEMEGERLLKMFHEQPENFRWEELLRHADITG